MDTLKINAYAKINLFLEVKERLPNGYHDLQSIMQSVGLCDVLEFRKTSCEGIHIDCPKIEGPCENNLIYKAAKCFFDKIEMPLSGVEIKVDKQIPIGAGLAGGSTDAAAALKALNTLYGEPFSTEELMAIGKTVGADVPFCICGGPAIAEGIGEKLTQINKLPDCYIVIAIGDTSVSTKWAFEELDKKEKRNIRSAENIISALKKGDLKDISDEFYNVFETVSPFDETIKKIMKSYSPFGVLMSGSGPSVFSVYKNEENAKKARSELISKGYRAFLCTPVNI